MIPFYDDSVDDTSDIPVSIRLDECLAENGNELGELVFEQVAFGHPMVILFSSGTTGVPKCIGE